MTSVQSVEFPGQWKLRAIISDSLVLRNIKIGGVLTDGFCTCAVPQHQHCSSLKESPAIVHGGQLVGVLSQAFWSGLQQVGVLESGCGSW